MTFDETPMKASCCYRFGELQSWFVMFDGLKIPLYIERDWEPEEGEGGDVGAFVRETRHRRCLENVPMCAGRVEA